MNSRSTRALALAGTVVIGLVVSAPGASAADTGNAFEAGVAAYKTVYPDLSDARARSAAAGALARRAVYDAAAADGATFGGAWFDPTTGVVNLAATTDAAVSRAAALGKQYAVAVKAVKVKRSAAALEADAADLRGSKDELGKAAAGNVGIDVTTNEVVVALPAARKAALAGEAKARGAKVVTASAPGSTAEPDAGCTTRAACDWTIRAGAIMWRGTVASPTPWCSVGFTARNSSNTRYVYTAGHCSTGIGINWGTGAQDIGPMSATMDSGVVDASIIQVTNSWFTSDSGGESYIGTGTHSMNVTGVAPTVGYMVAGETVCLSANFTNPAGDNMCGVLGTNSDAGWRGMARVDGLDACGGDSGGGWYWATGNSRVAYGIHSASSFGCHGDGGGTNSWFTPIASAKSLFQPTLNVEVRPL